MLMATAVSQLAEKTPGKESVAIEAFAHALRQVAFCFFFASFFSKFKDFLLVTNNHRR